MHSLIDNLIFPAPKPSYTTDNITGRIMFIPKFTAYAPSYAFNEQVKTK